MIHLRRIAEYMFKRLRTNCRYEKIVDYKRDGDYIIFYARFRCKRSVTIKSARIHVKCSMYYD